MGRTFLSKTNRKFRQRGFTLAELLIVVAIIGVLVAVSIPIFNSQVLKAKVAADNANMRAARAAAFAAFNDGDVFARDVGSISDKSQKWTLYWYDAGNGAVYLDGTSKKYGNARNLIENILPYGKTPRVRSKSSNTIYSSHVGKVCLVAVGMDDQKILMGWATEHGFVYQKDINSTYIQWYDDYIDASDLKIL